jgi:hypothetical protein
MKNIKNFLILAMVLIPTIIFGQATNYAGSWTSVAPSNSCRSVTGVTYTLSATNPGGCGGAATANCYVNSGAAITVTWPAGFGLAGVNSGTLNGTAITGITTTATTVSFPSPVAIAKGATITIVLNNVTNHGTAANYQLSMTIVNATGGNNTFAAGTTSQFAITIAPTSAPTSTAATNLNCTSFSANWSAVTGANRYYLDVSTTNTFTTFVAGYQNRDVGNVTTFSVTGLLGNTTYYYRVRAANGFCQNGTNSAVQSAKTLLCYCVVSGSSGAAGYVSRVRLNGIDRTSTYDGYINTGLTTTLLPGVSYNLDVTRHNPSTYTLWTAAWIDWNSNGVLTEAGENVMVAASSATAGAVTRTVSITVPTTAVTGSVVRLRVVMKYNSAPTGPCDAYATYVDWEDYNIIIGSAHCTNGIKDADETGVDCGGVDCPPCLSCYNECGSAIPLTSGVIYTGCNVGSGPGPFIQDAPLCNMSDSPTSWFTFTTNSTQIGATINITNTCFTRPNFAIFSACGTVLTSSCIEGSILSGYTPLSSNTTYYLAVTDAGGLTCEFDVKVNLFASVVGCVTGVLTPSVAGPYLPGQTVRWTFQTNSWNKAACNWIQGIVPTWGPCWDPTSFKRITNPISGSGSGSGWAWWVNGVVKYNLDGQQYTAGQDVGAGWFFMDRTTVPNPNGTWGDQGGCGGSCNNCTHVWRVVFDLTVRNQCDVGRDCMVKVKTFADGEIGAWNSPACMGDLPFINYQVADSGCVVPMPISLLSFDVNKKGENVLLEWVTLSETNNDYFTIEKSTDGFNFKEIGVVKGSGNSNKKMYYNFTDVNPKIGINYYRLKQTDFDGKFEYFQTAAINIKNMEISIFPNPTLGSVNINIGDSDGGNIMISVYSMTSNFTYTKEIVGRKNIIEEISLPNIGLYLIEVKTDNQIIREKVIRY